MKHQQLWGFLWYPGFTNSTESYHNRNVGDRYDTDPQITDKSISDVNRADSDVIDKVKIVYADVGQILEFDSKSSRQLMNRIEQRKLNRGIFIAYN